MTFSVRQLTRIAVLSALAIALRLIFGSLPNIKPVTAIFFATALTFGFWDGFLVMALTMCISGLFLGFGPWIAYQILDYGLLLILWHFLAPKLNVFWQTALVFFLTFMYGVGYDYVYGQFFNSGLVFVVSGLSYDFLHALSSLFFYPIILHIYRRFSS
ncbi:hypothetical protein [Streptococcus dentiloxodontae]